MIACLGCCVKGSRSELPVSRSLYSTAAFVPNVFRRSAVCGCTERETRQGKRGTNQLNEMRINSHSTNERMTTIIERNVKLPLKSYLDQNRQKREQKESINSLSLSLCSSVDVSPQGKLSQSKAQTSSTQDHPPDGGRRKEGGREAGELEGKRGREEARVKRRRRERILHSKCITGADGGRSSRRQTDDG